MILQAVDKGYFVDKDGAIHHRDRILLPCKAGGSKKRYNHKSIKYFVISLRDCADNKARKVFIHRLQVFQKFGDAIFKPKVCVQHLNGNSLDNSWDNISIGSLSSNSLDIPKNQRIATALLGANCVRKFTEEELTKVKEDRKNGFSLRELSIKHQTAKSTMSYICSGKTYKSGRGGREAEAVRL